MMEGMADLRCLKPRIPRAQNIYLLPLVFQFRPATAGRFHELPTVECWEARRH